MCVLSLSDQCEREEWTGRTTSESATLSALARLSAFEYLSVPLALRASCTPVIFILLEAKPRATRSTRLPSDVASFSTIEAGSRRQLSQCPHGVLSSAQEKSDEEKCLSSLSALRLSFFFSVDNKLCKLQFSAFFEIQAKLDHIMGLFMPYLSEPAKICGHEANIPCCCQSPSAFIPGERRAS